MSLARKMTPFTILLEHSGQRFQLPEESIFGTATGFEAPGLEPQHFIIRVQQGMPYLLDLNSPHGVFVNNVRVYPMQWMPLAPGTIIQAGALRLHFGALSTLSAVPEAAVDPTASTAASKTGATSDIVASDEATIAPTAAAVEATPATEPPPSSPNPDLTRTKAGFVFRLGAFLADQVLLTLFGWGLVELFPSLGSSALLWPLLLAAVAGVVLVPTRLSGKSLGKHLLGLKVVSTSEAVLSWTTVLKRELAFKLGLLFMAPAFGAGLLSALSPIVAGLGVVVFAAVLGLRYRSSGETPWDGPCGTQVLEDDP